MPAPRGATATWTNNNGDFLWSTTSANWSTGAWAAGDDAVFAAAGVGTITIAGTQSVGALTVDAAGYTLAGGTLALANAGSVTTWTLNQSAALSGSLDTTFTGTGGLTIAGAGTLTLSGTTTLAGPNTANNSLQVAAGGNLALTGGTHSLTDIRLASTGTTTITDATVSLARTGSSTGQTVFGLYVNGGSVTVAGTSTVTASDLVVGNSNAGSLTLSGTSLLESPRLHFNSAGNAGVVTLAGGTLAIGGVTRGAATNTTFNLDGGTIRATASSTDFLPNWITAASVKAGGVTFDTSGRNVTVAASLAHDAALGATPDGGLTKSGAGMLRLSGTNTYTGGTTVSAGTLVFITSAARPADGTTTVAAPGALVLGVGTGGFTTADFESLWANTLAGVSLDPAAAAGIDTTLGDATLSGTLGGTRALLVTGGTGTLTLSAANDYSGGTTVAGGTLRLANTAAAGSAAVSLGGGTLSLFRSGTTTTYANAIGVAAGRTGTLRLDGSGTNTSGNNSTYATGTITVDGTLGLFRPTGGFGNTVFNGLLVGSGTLVVDNVNGGVTPVSGTSQGRALFASSSNTFSGDVVIQNGGNFLNNTLSPSYASMQIGANSILTLITSSGSTTTTVGTLTGSGTVTKNTNDNTATLSVAAGDFGGVISAGNLFLGTGTIALAKTGPGTLSLSGANTYTGPTTIAAGTLRLTGGGLLGAGSAYGGSVANEGRFEHAGTGYQVLSGAVTGGGEVAVTGSGTLALSGANSYAGGTTVASGGLVLGSAAALPAGGAVSVTSGAAVGLRLGTGTFTVADFQQLQANAFPGVDLPVGAFAGIDTNLGSVTVAEVLSGSRGLVKTGGNTLTLSAANTYSGGTEVRGGTLALTGANTFTGGVTVAAGSTLGVGTGGTSGSLTADIANAGTVAFNRADDLAYAGAITGGGRVTKQAAGTLTLSGTSVNSGPSILAGGRVLVTAGSFGSATGSPVLFVGSGRASDGPTGAAAVRQTGGTVAVGNSQGQFIVGVDNVFGSYELAGGTLQASNVGTAGSLFRAGVRAGTFVQTGGSLSIGNAGAGGQSFEIGQVTSNPNSTVRATGGTASLTVAATDVAILMYGTGATQLSIGGSADWRRTASCGWGMRRRATPRSTCSRAGGSRRARSPRPAGLATG